jgi:hypothetical protein
MTNRDTFIFRIQYLLRSKILHEFLEINTVRKSGRVIYMVSSERMLPPPFVSFVSIIYENLQLLKFNLVASTLLMDWSK